MTSSKWFLPLFCVLGGAAMLAAQWIGGDPTGGLVSLAILSGFGALVLLGGRSETVRGLRGDGRDERFRQIDVRATALAGAAMIVATLLGALVELARGNDGGPYTWLAAVAGVAYLGSVMALRSRG
ncbi:MAG: hypothetical protein ACRDM1_03095 [Gaiellaceae bacterium]